MYANSKIPDSAQQGVHENLVERVRKHARSEFRKPYLDYNKAAFAASLEGWDGQAPLILDAGCGVGHSTIQLARAFPDHWVIGVDQSADRLARKKPYPDALLPKNMVFVRGPKGFQATEVVIGERSGGRIEIISGIPAGAVIATKGAFLLKAELGKGEAEH